MRLRRRNDVLRPSILGAEGERGGTLAEFALAATLCLTLIYGVLEFGRALFTYDLVANGARLGTRYAVVRGANSCTTSGCAATSNDVQTFVRGQSPGIDTTMLNVTATWPTNSSGGCTVSPYNGIGCVVTVTATYQFSFLAFSFSPITMTSVSQMVISQ